MNTDKKRVDPRGIIVALLVGIAVYFVAELILRNNPDVLPLITQFYYHDRFGHPTNLLALIIAILAAGLSGYIYEEITGTTVDNWKGPPNI